MALHEKEKILNLKEKGMSYKEISDLLGIPRSTVSTIIKRNKGIEKADRCVCCGIEIKSDIVGRKKKYCSDKCRKRWWRLHGNHRINITSKCLCCGKEIDSHESRIRKFCSMDCYLAYRGGSQDE